MKLYKTCADCGANLDPGERCECRKKRPVLEHKPADAHQMANIKHHVQHTTRARKKQVGTQVGKAWEEWRNA